MNTTDIEQKMEQDLRPATSTAASRAVRFSRMLMKGCVALSAALLMCASLVYANRPDFAAAITVFPVWIWPIPGVLALAPVLFRRRPLRIRPAAGVLTLLWVLYVAVFAEEPRSLLILAARQMDGGTTTVPGFIHVVSLNCAGGDPLAAKEVIAQHPDIVLLQEPPPSAQMQGVARSIFGMDAGWVADMDAAIVVRGTIGTLPVPKELRGSLIRGRARLTSGISLDLASFRLTPAVFRMDLWSPDCWAAQSENRTIRRDMLRRIAASIVANGNDPLIVGGDFNAPQGDTIYSELRPRLSDAFSQGGIGWGNTITNEMPALRIDQVWLSRELSCVQAYAVKTVHSDHRMVVCDLVFNQGIR